MLYFNPKPNYHILSKYYKLQFPVEQMALAYNDGYPIVIDWIYTDEMVKEVEDSFLQILKKYKLQPHHDNLLFLCLSQIQGLEATLYELNFQYAQRRRTKELAGLLLGFLESPRNEYNGLLLKTFKSTTKLSDQVLIEWVGRIIKEAIEKGNMHIGDFQFDIREAFFDKSDNGFTLNKNKLVMESQKTLSSPTKHINSRLADFCFYLYPYLINETDIKLDTTIKFSDAQLNFYFDTLVIFEFIDPNKVNSEPKDYMGALIRNALNNADNQGNKSNKN